MGDGHSEEAVQVFSSDVRFQCPTCQAFSETRMEVPEPNWAAAEDISQLYAEGLSLVSCSDCGDIFDVYVYFTHGDCTASFPQHSDTAIDIGEPMYWPPEDEWTDPGITAAPYQMYDQCYRQLQELSMELGEADGDSIINRMIFAQHISAMEAYLCDALVNATAESRDVLLKLISSDADLKKASFSLTDVAKGEDVAMTYVIGYLKNLLYHNLTKIDSLYRSGLGFSILPSGDDRKKLFNAVKLRHDCVHRNGFDVEGNPPTAFTQDYVSETAGVIKRVVERVNSSIHW